jgi:hypothetical protein
MRPEPFYEKQLSTAPLLASGGLAHNVYYGYFLQMGTRTGRAATAQPMGDRYDNRFKTFKQLEYSLPASMKNFR